MSSSINNGEGANIKRIGIIGGGAAGLATARAFLRANNNNDDDDDEGTKQKKKVQFEVTVLETRNSVGGIWKYDDDDNHEGKKSRPMYRNLRTNLPKELMAFREFPWGAGDCAEPSYVTHKQVYKYLEDYANTFDLLENIRFGCRVDHLKVVRDKGEHKHETKEGSDELDCDSWPQISLKWTDNTDNQSHQQTFDNICICNGHYDLPSNPPLRGLKNFPGRVIHAIEYDTPTEFAGKTVLCVGARASGADIAREIGSVAKRVYLSDSSCNAMEEFGTANVVVSMPRTQSVDKYGGIHFFSSGNNGSNDEEWTLNDVDVIIFCSGYDYAFPFIDGESNLELENVLGERRIRPVYEQLWHAQYPSLSFIGLPHSVVPFPLFEIQSTAVVSQLISRVGSVGLPSLSERLVAAESDASSGGPVTPGRVQDTHFLGSYQWDYCRNVAKKAGVYNDDMENYIATNKALYDCSGKERKGVTPGGDDVYRETRFRRMEKEQSYEILHSEIMLANPTVKT
eukprot:CAMPEP_0201603364 /NCGR_PEP_ID=MMETSP0492-20130828/3825_1 /ASSEMBLY_ACC=CAM_ASM_000837 /TAXON_ID=420259 /ORGANISM="Thalassiosira gravida, Strain GMp14c1" /LENGTH=510 /DNA_ID=CAMNT_0048067121 /DNA_START=233 /DNA_END=1765 /DNA_ORIENTATION=+